MLIREWQGVGPLEGIVVQIHARARGWIVEAEGWWQPPGQPTSVFVDVAFPVNHRSIDKATLAQIEGAIRGNEQAFMLLAQQAATTALVAWYADPLTGGVEQDDPWPQTQT